MKRILPFPSGGPELEWIGGRYPFPERTLDGDELIQMELVIWLELPSILIVGSAMVDERKPVSLGETLAATMAQPLVGSPRRPARIRVANAQLAKEVRGAADGIPVVVAPVPELDETFNDFAESFEESRPDPSYLGDGEIAPDSIAKLFSAASLLFRTAPWKHVFDQQLVRVDIPDYEIDGACLSVIGAAGESFGLLLFRSLHDFECFGRATPRPSDGRAAMRSLSFDRKKDLPPSMLREIAQHGWPVAGPKAYPVLISVDAEMQPLPPTGRDVRIMTACTRAFLAFFATQREIFENDTAEPVRMSSTGDDGVTVTLTAPYGNLALFEDEDDDFYAPAPPAPSAPRVGRNEPCPCDSGKKYKKCHLDADQMR